MNTFTASYSVLSLWDKGDKQRAIESYFKLKEFSSEAMDLGKHQHEVWAKQIMQTNEVPYELGGMKLVNPVVETRFTMQLDDEIELTGIIDCYDELAFYDWKTGVTPSNTYAGTQQLPLYALLLMANKIFLYRGVIVHYDTVLDKTDSTHVLMSDTMLEEAATWAIITAHDMHYHLKENELYDQYQSVRDLSKANAQHP